MVMQSSTGHTSQHRLQPTHSCSSTRGIRAGGVLSGAAPFAPSSFGIGVTAIRARLAAVTLSGVA
jgi:hypothetical protein